MQFLDYLVLAVYFVVLIVIGIYSALRVKKQEDFFMGGRSFGKLLQTFAAFGAGTGSSDPVNTARTTFTSGVSGMWSVMTWLFVTPFYWITGVWYRRMRHLTLGDWFVERYDSRGLGAAYCVFGLLFFMVYGSMMFSAIGKVAAPMMGIERIQIAGSDIGLEYVLVPLIGLIVLIYGLAGGLRAAYLTDLVQGVCIIGLSVMLIPFGLAALVKTDPTRDRMMQGFEIMHERLSPDMFDLIGSSSSDFPLHRIVAVVIIILIGIVVQPHFIATGGGSAKTEWNARFGLVVGNFLKRLCTLGWVLTALIAVTLYADSPELLSDPDRTWGVASRDLLGPGLTGLMLACLLAALMSSADAYMIVGSSLVVRNIYAAYINPNASEQTYLWIARCTGGIVIAGAVLVSLFMMNVFKQLQLTWVFPVLFAAPFWVGMYWRRATAAAAWATVGFCATTFFLIPFFLPLAVPTMRDASRWLQTTELATLETTRPAAPVDVQQENARRRAARQAWQADMERIAELPADQQAAARAELGAAPPANDLQAGDPYTIKRIVGGDSIYWNSGVQPVDDQGKAIQVELVRSGEPRRIDENTVRTPMRYPEQTRLRGEGNFRPDFLLYDLGGFDLTRLNGATLSTLELPPKILAPFIVMFAVSLFTRKTRSEVLDRYYIKMKTPVVPDAEADAAQLQEAYAQPEKIEQRKLFPGSDWEFSRPTTTDIVGFLLCFLTCFAIIGVAALMSRLGS